MAFVLSDRIKETTTTTSTGTYTLGGAVSGFETFTANLSNGDTTYYCCTDGTDFEVGLGTFASSGTTLARTTIISSSNSNNAVNWSSGSRDIFCTLPGSKVLSLDGSGDLTLVGANGNIVFDKSDDRLEFADGVQARFGNGADFSIAHDNNRAEFFNYTGDFVIRNNANDKDVVLQTDDGSGAISQYFRADGSTGEAIMYYYGSQRFTTSSDGAKISGGTGDAVLLLEADTTNTDENDNPRIEYSQDGGGVTASHGTDGNNRFFIQTTTGTGTTNFDMGGGVETNLYYGTNKKFETTSSGAAVTGTLAATLSTAAQPNVTSLGTLTGLTTSGSINLSQTSGTAIKTTGGLANADLGVLRASAGTGGNDSHGFTIKYMGSRIGNNNAYALFMDNQTGTDVEAMTVLQDGKVGINNISPSAPLDVSGDAEITGTLTAGEVSATTLDIGGTNITATATEINKLDGVTATTTELNYVDVTTLGTVEASKAVTADANGDVLFPDNNELKFGNGGDLFIRHEASGGHSVIRESGAGTLFIDASDLQLRSGDFQKYAVFTLNGSAELYHDNVKKFETTSDGATVTGTLAATLSTAAQTNITSLGTLTGLTTSGNIELGHASDTTLARSSAGVVTIEGNTILTTGNSDTPSTTTSSSDADFVLVDDGGTMKKITPANLGITSGSASKGFAVAMAIAL